MKKLLYKFALWLAAKAYAIAFDYIDKDNDGKISKEELEEITKDIKLLYTRAKLLSK